MASPLPPALQPLGMHHVALIASDYARSKRFYTEVMGVPVVHEQYRAERQSYKLDLQLPDGTQLELFSFPSPPARPSFPEACGLRLSQVDIESRVLHVARLKKGLSTTHPLRLDEVRAIKAWLGDRKKKSPDTDAFFVSERRTPLNRKTAWVAIRAYGEKAELSVAAHPHMLRHACGFALADQGADTRLIQDYLGHRNIQHTVIYTATNPARFEKLWR